MERDKLLGSMDAKVWTDEFMATKARLGDEEFDHAMMLAWFANAIMAGFDEANRRAQRALDAEREKVKELKQRVRRTPLPERLVEARSRIGKMCSEGRPPRMTIPVQHDDDDFYISTTLADAQATIADLQGQLDASLNEARILRKCQENQKRTIETYQQRVGQLEAGCEVCRKRYDNLSTQYGTLQADHARVLGLVQALGVVGLPAEHTRPDDFILLKTGEGWMAHTYNYWAKFATEEEARAYIALLEYRASLPAQPAQGKALIDRMAHINDGCECRICKPAQGGA